MKKFFTYLFASAAFCMIGTVNAMAQDDEVVEDDLLPDMFMNWTDPENPTDEEIKNYIVGNLCRCTGYQSQFKAIKAYLAEVK